MRGLDARNGIIPFAMAATTEPDAAAPPDPQALAVLLDGRYRPERERARALLWRPEFAPVAGLERERHRALVLERIKLLAREPDTAAGFPVEYGGRGDVGASVAWFETLAHGDLSVLIKFGVQFGLFGGALLHLGTRRHHDAHLRPMLDAELLGCFAMTETGHGSNVQGIETTATYDPEAAEFVVHTPHESARKDYIGNAARDGRMAVVFAQLLVGGEAHGVHALLVPLRADDGAPLPGVRIEDCGSKLGLNGVDNGRIRFDRVRVPRDALLDRYAQVDADGSYRSEIENADKRFFTMVGTLVQGRVSVAGAAISAAKSALTIAVRYGLERRQFGPQDSGREMILLDYRAHQRRLFPLLATTYALHFSQQSVIGDLDEGFNRDDEQPERERRRLEVIAAGVKAAATWHATATIQACREACGGAGYLAENRFAALKADTDVFTTFEGDNTVLLQLVAKGLLTDYKARFGDYDQLEMLRVIGAQVFETVVEKTLARTLVGALLGAVPGGDDDADVRDTAYHVDMFRWREEHVLGSLARRLKRGLDDGQSSFDVFNDCQDHVIAAARAHVDRLVLDAFVARVEACEDPALEHWLEVLCDLHALSTIERERGWFFEHGRLNAPRSKAVTATVNRICGELRAHAAALVDAFAIPDAALAAPIAARGS